MIRETSEYAGGRERNETEMKFLSRFHSAKKLTDLAACDHRIFIYRDPLQRAASAFVDKFVIRRGNSDIFRNFFKVTGIEPENATFDLFVRKYLSKPPQTIDPHCVGQYEHLLPLLYTEAIPMHSLFESMTSVLGDVLARRYFFNKVNAITEMKFDSPCYDTPSSNLHDRFRREGRVPTNSSLLTEENVGVLRKVYRADLILLSQLSRA